MDRRFDDAANDQRVIMVVTLWISEIGEAEYV